MRSCRVSSRNWRRWINISNHWHNRHSRQAFSDVGPPASSRMDRGFFPSTNNAKVSRQPTSGVLCDGNCQAVLDVYGQRASRDGSCTSPLFLIPALCALSATRKASPALSIQSKSQFLRSVAASSCARIVPSNMILRLHLQARFSWNSLLKRSLTVHLAYCRMKARFLCRWATMVLASGLVG